MTVSMTGALHRLWATSSCLHDVTATYLLALNGRCPLSAVRCTPETRHWAVARVDARMAGMGR